MIYAKGTPIQLQRPNPLAARRTVAWDKATIKYDNWSNFAPGQDDNGRIQDIKPPIQHRLAGLMVHCLFRQISRIVLATTLAIRQVHQFMVAQVNG